MSGSSLEPSSETAIARLQNFVEQNRKALLIGAGVAAVAAAAGVAYYVSSSSSSGRGDGDLESGSGKRKDKKKKGKKRKNGKDSLKDGGPILEESKPKVEKVVLGKLLMTSYDNLDL